MQYSFDLSFPAGLTLHYVAVGLIYQPVPAKYLSDWKAKSSDDPHEAGPNRADNISDILYRSNLSLNAPGSVSFEPQSVSLSRHSINSPVPNKSALLENGELRVRTLDRSLSVETNGAINKPENDIRIQMLKRSISVEPPPKNQIQNKNESEAMLGHVTISKDQSHERASSCDNAHEKSRDIEKIEPDSEENEHDSCCVKISKQFGFNMLKNADFIVLMLLMFGVFFTFSCGQFLFGLGKEILGLTSSEIAYVLSVASALEIISRPVCGAVFDLPIVRPHKRDLWLLSGILCGISLIILPFSNSFAMFFIFWILYTTFAGIVHVQHLGIISDLVGSKNLASAMGLIRFSMGMGLLLGPTLGGMLKDKYDTYLYSFILLGSSIILFFSVFKVVICIQSVIKNKQ